MGRACHSEDDRLRSSSLFPQQIQNDNIRMVWKPRCCVSLSRSGHEYTPESAHSVNVLNDFGVVNLSPQNHDRLS